MADPVADLTNAPKKVVTFASNNLLAFALLAFAMLLAFVWYESRNPQKIRTKLISVPIVGPWVTNTPKAG